jgi:hypothetical protein
LVQWNWNSDKINKKLTGSYTRSLQRAEIFTVTAVRNSDLKKRALFWTPQFSP